MGTVDSTMEHKDSEYYGRCIPQRNQHDYQELKPLYDSNFGRVILAQHKETKQLFAIKTSKLQDIAKTAKFENPITECGHLRQFQASQEAMVEKQCKEAKATTTPAKQSIVRLHDEFIHGDSHWAVMEYMDGGDSFQMVQAHGRYGECRARVLARQLLHAVSALHRHNIAHLDVKPENVLLFKDKDEIKLTDLGAACSTGVFREQPGWVKRYGSPKGTCTRIGTITYSDPDGPWSLDRELFNGFAADLYSCGVVIFFWITGSHAYSKPSMQGDEYFRNIFNEGKSFLQRQLRAFGGVRDDVAADLLSQMICPLDRRFTSIDKVLQHAWFRQADESIVVSV